MIYLLLIASLSVASPSRMWGVHSVRAAPVEAPPAENQPRAVHARRSWIGPWIPPPPPVVVKVVHVQASPPPPPKKTAWQLGPTRVENPGKPIAFSDLPSAFTPLPAPASVASED